MLVTAKTPKRRVATMPLSNATYGKSDQDKPAANEPASAPSTPEPDPVAEQKAAGVPAEDTVTIADQKAGTPPPIEPSNAPGFPAGNGPAAPQLHPELHGQ